MKTGLDSEKLAEYKAAALKHLSDPAKLRMLVVSGLVLSSVVLAYMPLTQQIAEKKAFLADKKRRLDAIKDVEVLRGEVDSYRRRIPKDADTNEWVQYILAGLREVRVKLRDMESKPPRKVGPYHTVTLAIEVEGTYAEVKRFVEWLEQSDRLLRIDSTRLEKQSDSLVMRLVLLGLVHKNAKPA
jgi:Tfp pilus assembly protein PilO